MLLSAACTFLALGCPASGNTGNIDFRKTEKTVLKVTVDGEPLSVTWHKGGYLLRPNRPQDQMVNVYIPSNATKASPIMLYVDNAGWLNNHYRNDTVLDGASYSSDSDEKVATALMKGYVVVSYGCRSRGNRPTDGQYLGHSPATMTDTKAVVRYLKYNRKRLPAGNVDRIIVTGISGGGALSTLIAASGNSPDFLESLYEIGAAGVHRQKDGTLCSEKDCGDDVYGVIAYCPITDLGHACAAYEWLYHDTRRALFLAGEEHYDFVDEKELMSASTELAAMYADYLDSLGLKDRNGNVLDSGNFREFITSLMKEELGRALSVKGAQAMLDDVNCVDEEGIRRVNNGWLRFDADGHMIYDLDKHLYYVAKYTSLKPAPAFSNKSLFGAPINEDSLFGSISQASSPFNRYSWNHDTMENGVGMDDTGLDWDSFLLTEDGQRLQMQLKMSSAVDYLIEGKSDTAPFWYVRHGMDDRDTSFAVEALLFAAIWNNSSVRDANARFEFLQYHNGDYDIPEAYGWLESVLRRP